MPNRRSLRVRLVAIALALTAVGLAIAGAVTYTSIRSFLVERVDEDLRDAFRVVAVVGLEDGDDDAGPSRGRPRRGASLPKGTVSALYNGQTGAFATTQTQGITFPDRMDEGLRTVSLSGQGEYRFLVSDRVDLGPDPGGVRPLVGRLAVGVPLADVEETLNRLLLISLLVGIGALAAAGALGYWLVRLGLRPLTAMEATAGHIATGDLSRRIDDTDPDTEVGRLGAALNTMLAKIESAFAEREASEKRLRQFVADASHELQTPLTSVRGYAELFRRGAADHPEDLANAMSRIEAESERMGLLVDDMLLLARLDEHRPLNREPVNLTELTRQLVADARIVDPGRRYDLRLDGPVIVDADRDRVAQVIGNLLRNVRAHTPDGTPVTLAVRAVGEQAMIEVADSGPGMSAEHAERIFERFFRADTSRARSSGGTGLGLAIVAASVQAHGGRVEVETAPGAGATFRVWLPIEPSLAASVSDTQAATNADTDSQETHSPV